MIKSYYNKKIGVIAMDFFKKIFKKEPKEEIVEEQPVDVPVMETSPQINLMASDPLLNQTNIEENKIEKNEVLGIEKQLLEKNKYQVLRKKNLILVKLFLMLLVYLLI